jgi:hypothetical protein
VPLERWLAAFPSFGFVMTARPDHVAEVIRIFRQRDIACANVGSVDESRKVVIEQGGDRAEVWNFTRQLTGCSRDRIAIEETEYA